MKSFHDVEIALGERIAERWGDRPWPNGDATIGNLCEISEAVDDAFDNLGFKFETDAYGITDFDEQPTYNCLSRGVLGGMGIVHAGIDGLKAAVELTEWSPQINGAGRVLIHGEPVVVDTHKSAYYRLPDKKDLCSSEDENGKFYANVVHFKGTDHYGDVYRVEPIDGSRPITTVFSNQNPRHQESILLPVDSSPVATYAIGAFRTHEAAGDYRKASVTLLRLGGAHPHFQALRDNVDAGDLFTSVLWDWYKDPEAFEPPALEEAKRIVVITGGILADTIEEVAEDNPYKVKQIEVARGLTEACVELLDQAGTEPEARTFFESAHHAVRAFNGFEEL